MSQINFDDLEVVRAWAQKRIERADTRSRMSPMNEVVRGMMESTISRTNELMAGPYARSRISFTNLEKSVAEFPLKMQEVEREAQATLNSMRRRTAALQLWLQELS